MQRLQHIMTALWGIVFGCTSVWACYLLYEPLYSCICDRILYVHGLVLHLNFFFLHFSPDYGVDFFKKFTMVMNALDNRGEGSLSNVSKHSFPVMYLQSVYYQT